MADGKKKVIIKKKGKKGGHGHHGGSWKVAYADFVTAMMAFFLLMWLLNMSTKEQKESVAHFFETFSIFDQTGDSMMEGQSQQIKQEIVRPTGTETQDPGSLATVNATEGHDPRANASLPGETGPGGPGTPGGQDIHAPAAPATKEELQKALEEVIQNRLAPFRDQILVQAEGEGVRVQVIDKDGRPLFEKGKDTLTPAAQEVLAGIVAGIGGLNNAVAIEGHTDALPFSSGGVTNWELSTSRAAAARRAMEKAGFDSSRLVRVTGYADTQPLLPENPKDSRNRRISLMVYAAGKGEKPAVTPANPAPASPAPAQPAPVQPPPAKAVPSVQPAPSAPSAPSIVPDIAPRLAPDLAPPSSATPKPAAPQPVAPNPAAPVQPAQPPAIQPEADIRPPSSSRNFPKTPTELPAQKKPLAPGQ